MNNQQSPQMIVAAALLIGLVTSPAYAVDCASQITQLDINECVATDYQTADTEMNRVYADYRSRLNDERRQQLKDAQAAWIEFRDLSCKFESADVIGGSAYPMVLHSCLAEKTRTRIAELKKLSDCREGDLSCPVHR